MKLNIILLALLLFSCSERIDKKKKEGSNIKPVKKTSLIILGTVQDGGSPHAGCQKKCCKDLWFKPNTDRKVVSLGLIDPESKKTFLFEATPDISSQLEVLNKHLGFNHDITPDGIFLTHAHIGHYTGLMYLGREVMNANKAKVYAMPRMKSFLQDNGPWHQLITLDNIEIIALNNKKSLKISDNLSVVPLLVPHRDEFSETVGFKILGPNKSVLFIPDIDKWHKWDHNIVEEVKKVDFALIDATFFANNEVKGRDMSEIPHPFVKESLNTLSHLTKEEKSKVYFIHFNHSNPLLTKDSDAYKEVIRKGFNVSFYNQVINL